MNTSIKSENIKRTKNTVKGTFKLSDKTTTHFDIDRQNGWNQWGNSTENLGLTVDRVETLYAELLNS